MNLSDLARRVARGALLWATLTGCSVRMDWPEHTLSVSQRLDATRDTTAGGDALTIEQLVLVVDQLELVACEDDAIASQAAWLATASAHGEAGPTLLVPHIAEPLVGAGSFIGTLAPPPGRWCGARVLLRAGTDELIGAQAASMRGASMALGGRWGDDAPLTLRTAASAERVVPLEAPLELGEQDAVTARLALVWSPAGVADAVRAVGDDEAMMSRAALSRLLDGARLEVAP